MNPSGRKSSWRAELGPRLPLVAAAAVFAGLSLVNLKPSTTDYVVVKPVAAGQPLSAGDVAATSAAQSVNGRPGDVARVPLVPGQTLVVGDLDSTRPNDAEISLPLDGVAAGEVATGQYIQLAQAMRHGVWLSPPLEVLAVAGGTTGSVVLGGPLAQLLALLPHAGSAWVIVDPPRGGAR